MEILDLETQKKSSLLPTLMIGVLFFIFGFATWANGTLIPYLKIACELSDPESLLVATAFYMAYFFTPIPSSWLLNKIGFKNGMMWGLIVMAMGALVFVPAAQSRTFPLFLTGLFIIGTGLSILQTAANPYVIIVGPIESAAQRISIMGICNKFAGVLAPIILGAIILSNADTLEQNLKTMNVAEKAVVLNELASRVIMPYTVLAGFLIFLAILVKLSPLPEIESQDSVSQKNDSTSKTSVFQFPNLILGVIAIFVYVGVEVIAVDSIGLFGLSQGFSINDSKIFPSYTTAAMVVGYILGIIAIPKFISQEKALALSAIVGMIFTVIAIYSDGFTSVLFIAVLGLAHALMWPAIWPLAIDKLGKFTKIGSAMLIMAIVGGATIPLLFGKISQIPSVGMQQAFWVLIPFYLFILFYSLKGHKIKNW